LYKLFEEKKLFRETGVQDKAFCQYIADATGKTVSAGPVEAAAIGNYQEILRRKEVPSGK